MSLGVPDWEIGAVYRASEAWDTSSSVTAPSFLQSDIHSEDFLPLRFEAIGASHALPWTIFEFHLNHGDATMMREQFSGRMLCTGCLLWSLLGPAQIHAQSLDDSVQDAGRRGLRAVLERIPRGQEGKYGFQRREEFLQSYPGRPIRVYSVIPDSLRNEIIPEKEYLIACDEWRIPIEVNGEARSLLTITRVDGAPTVVSLGGTELAREIAAIGRRDREMSLSMLRLYQMECDFLILVPKGKRIREGGFQLLRSAEKVFSRKEFDPSVSHPARKVLTAIRQKYIDRFWSR